MENDKLITIAVIAAVVLGIVALIIFVRKALKKVHSKKAGFFSNMASEYNLNLKIEKNLIAKLNILSGEINGNQIMVYEKIIGSGQNRTINTFITFDPNPFDFSFTISKEQVFSKIGKKLGFKDIEFDDFEFDKTFLLKSKDEEKFRRLIDYTIQSELKKTSDSLAGSIRSNDNVFEYQFPSALFKENQLDNFKNVLDLMLKLTKKASELNR